jgi:hypothetical protein
MATQVYRFFLDNPPTNQFLFIIKLEENFRPKLGDSITDPTTFRNWKVMRDEFTPGGFIRLTDEGLIRLTDEGNIRVTTLLAAPKFVTHNYFIQPANNPNRVSTWTRSDFADDQALRQLYR